MRSPAAGAPRAPSSAVQRRIIVAACPRAGGVRVRGAIATHPAIHDPGETGLFDALLHGEWRGWQRWPGVDDDGVARPAPVASRLRLRTSLRRRVAEIDRQALAGGSRNWIERIAVPAGGVRALQRVVAGVRVIHVIRDGRDVVAAQCQRMAQLGDGRCRYGDAQRAVAAWNRSLAWHERALGRPGHLFVLFEDWAREPERESRRLAHACGLPDEASHSVDLSADGPLPWVRAERYQLHQLFGHRHRRRLEAALDLERYGQLAGDLRRRMQTEGPQQAPRTLVPVEREQPLAPEAPTSGVRGPTPAD